MPDDTASGLRFKSRWTEFDKLRDLQLTAEIAELCKEVESKTDTILVNDMLHEDIKERIKDKCVYDIGDVSSDCESDEEERELAR